MKTRNSQGPLPNAGTRAETKELPAGKTAAQTDALSRHREGRSGQGQAGEPPPKVRSGKGFFANRKRKSGNVRAVSSGRKERKFKVFSLIDKVYRWENLYTAWRRVRKNRGAHGLDKVTIQMFEANHEVHLREIQRKLMEKRYEPKPVRRVYIPKASDPTRRRPLGIPAVADRVVQQAILQIVDPIFDGEMSERSFGGRKGRKAHQAIATVIQDGKEGFNIVVDADIQSFFDQIPHDVVMSAVRARIADGRVLDLFEMFLKAGVSEEGVVTVPKAGVPQGGVISPWLSNLVLDELDKALEAKGWRHTRYVDDFVICCKSREEAEEALVYAKEVLGKLKLSLHQSKTRVSDFCEGFEFLGFRFRCGRMGIRSQSIEKFKDKIRWLTRRQQGRNVDAVIADVNRVVRGWARYFGVAETHIRFRDLDKWVRMRIRAFRLQRKCTNDNWRLPKRRLAKWGLLSLLDCRPALRLSYARSGGP